MGSTFWGSTALFFLDPIDNIAVGVNKLFGKKLIKSGSMTVTQQPMNTDVIARSDWHDYWGTLLKYSKLNRQELTDTDELVIQKYQADVVYTFNPAGTWRPYIVGSFGELDAKKNGIRANTKQFTQYGVGLGLTYAISAKWFLHTEFHNYYSNSFSDPDVDTESKVMIAYRFGNGEG